WNPPVLMSNFLMTFPPTAASATYTPDPATAAPQLPLTEPVREAVQAVVPSTARMRLIVRKLAMIGSPFDPNTTPSYAPASMRSTDRKSSPPSRTFNANSFADTDAPLPERAACTCPLLTPATHVLQSPVLKGMLTNHNS